MNEWMYDNGVCRKSPATPAVKNSVVIHYLYKGVGHVGLLRAIPTTRVLLKQYSWLFTRHRRKGKFKLQDTVAIMATLDAFYLHHPTRSIMTEKLQGCF